MTGKRYTPKFKAKVVRAAYAHSADYAAKRYKIATKTAGKWMRETREDTKLELAAEVSRRAQPQSIAEAVAKSMTKDSPMHEVIALLRQARMAGMQGRLKKVHALVLLALSELEGS